MSVLLIVLPLAIVMAGLAAVAFCRAVHSGQFDDLEGAPYRAVFDEEPDAREPR